MDMIGYGIVETMYSCIKKVLNRALQVFYKKKVNTMSTNLKEEENNKLKAHTNDIQNEYLCPSSYKLTDNDEKNLEDVLNKNPTYNIFYKILDYTKDYTFLKSNYYLNMYEFFKKNNKTFLLFFVDEFLSGNIKFDKYIVYNYLNYDSYPINKKKILLSFINSQFKSVEIQDNYNVELKVSKVNKELIKDFILKNDLEYPKLGYVRIAQYYINEDGTKNIVGSMTLTHENRKYKHKNEWKILNFTDSIYYYTYKESSFSYLLDYFIQEYKPSSISIKIPKRYYIKGFMDYIKNDNKYSFKYEYSTNPSKFFIFKNKTFFNWVNKFYRIEELFYEKYKFKKYFLGTVYNRKTKIFLNYLYDLGCDVYKYERQNKEQ